ncbi:MAG: hypothetical protein QF848_15360 [Planctomycetota bacterium]|jgi:hypothetical protein|nr:hypothetical protein [Planctomycetota bacterium]
MTEKEELEAALYWELNPSTRALIIDRLRAIRRDSPELREQAMQAGMEFGIQGYNDVMGYDSYTPEPCGHHCRDCPRCGY